MLEFIINKNKLINSNYFIYLINKSIKTNIINFLTSLLYIYIYIYHLYDN